MSSNRVTPITGSQIFSQYANLNEDVGYRVKRENNMIHILIPYEQDIEPRLVNYLRSLYFYTKYGITHCMPLELMFYIRRPDWNKIHRYLKKHRIRTFENLFNKNR
jgi:hypothetical protein